MSGGKRAAIYLRVSSEEQERDGFGLPAQLEACRGFCDRLEYRVVRRLQDVESGREPGRPAFQYLMHLASRGAFDVLVVARRDRYFRNAVEAGYYERQLRAWGVRIEAVDIGPQEDTKTTRFYSRIIDAVAELDRESTVERLAFGRIQAARFGYWPTKAPYGYRLDADNRLALEPEQAKRMQEAYAAVIMGRNREYVGRMLSIDGRSASRRIGSTLYKGEARYGDVVVPCPAVVDAETWQRAQDALESRFQANAPAPGGPYSRREWWAQASRAVSDAAGVAVDPNDASTANPLPEPTAARAPQHHAVVAAPPQGQEGVAAPALQPVAQVHDDGQARQASPEAVVGQAEPQPTDGAEKAHGAHPAREGVLAAQGSGGHAGQAHARHGH